ncbi:hypothetical protein AG0111_0g9155 [Alternaria gaisen]|uniref:Uncharacterized protein n=1 Tax=Alternaria gaisen TaxID=167740 RepID=A0ACB6FEB9_9PLEO|nr:hypothetical protein AG0111_0g9155 [Alternaria gaisen]
MSNKSGSGRDRNSEMPAEKNGKAEREAILKAKLAETLRLAQRLLNELSNDKDAPEPAEILETTGSNVTGQEDEEDDLVKKSTKCEPELSKDKRNSGKANMDEPTTTTSHAHHEKQNLEVSSDLTVTEATLTEKVGVVFDKKSRCIARRKKSNKSNVEILVLADELQWLRRTVARSDLQEVFEHYERAKEAGEFRKVAIPRWHEVQVLESVSLDTDVNSGEDDSSDDDTPGDEKNEPVLPESGDYEQAGVDEQDSLVADAETQTEPDQAARDDAESSSSEESQSSRHQRVSRKDEAATREKKTDIPGKSDRGDEAADKASRSKKDNKRGSAAPASMQRPGKKPKSAKTVKHGKNSGKNDMEGIVDADPEQL